MSKFVIFGIIMFVVLCIIVYVIMNKPKKIELVDTSSPELRQSKISGKAVGNAALSIFGL